MSITETKEMQKTVPVITYAFAVLLVIILIGGGYLAGRTTAKIEAQDTLFKTELSGLRADMEKADDELKEEISDVNKRIDRKLTNHVNEKHK